MTKNDAVERALQDSACVFDRLRKGKPDDHVYHLLAENCHKALQALQTSRPDAADSLDADEWVDIQIEHHENQISELKPMDIYRYSHEYERLKTIRAALKSVDKGRWQDISTAPRDGTQILASILTEENKRYCEIVWFKDENWVNGYFDKYEDDYTFKPTHWQAIVPPTSEGV